MKIEELMRLTPVEIDDIDPATFDWRKGDVFEVIEGNEEDGVWVIRDIAERWDSESSIMEVQHGGPVKHCQGRIWRIIKRGPRPVIDWPEDAGMKSYITGKLFIADYTDNEGDFHEGVGVCIRPWGAAMTPVSGFAPSLSKRDANSKASPAALHRLVPAKVVEA